MLPLKRLMLIICVFSSINTVAAKLTIQISNHSAKNKVTLDIQGVGEKEIIIDKTGKGELDFSNYNAGYVTLIYGMAPRTLWLEPDKDLNISFDATKLGQKPSFSGSLANINNYLNNSDLQEIMINDCRLKEAGFMAKADSLLNDNFQKLNRAKLPDNFTEVEKKRLTYFTYSTLTYFPQFYPRVSKDTTYIPSATYLNKVKALCVMDTSLLKIEAYKEYLANATSLISQQEMPDIKPAISRNIAYIEKNIANPAIAEFLINQFVYAYIKRNGTQHAEQYLTTFHRYVKDAGMTEAMNQLCNKWEKLQVGKPSPEFNATDLSGKKVSLADLKGKLIYIDVWATWCGPCRKEMPYLMKLEEKYKGKEIHFVSLSCDASRQAWEKDLAKGDKKGIQIHLAAGDTFMDDYMILGIPRFILLNKEGQIINSDMTRPSDPDTVKTLDELLK